MQLFIVLRLRGDGGNIEGTGNSGAVNRAAPLAALALGRR